MLESFIDELVKIAVRQTQAVNFALRKRPAGIATPSARQRKSELGPITTPIKIRD